MSNIYTRRGDAGETDLFGGPRVSKDDLRVEAYGAVDELNAALGVCAAASPHHDLRAICRDQQGAPQEAEQLYHEILSRVEPSATLCYHMALALLHQEKTERARSWLDQALALDPAHPAARANCTAAIPTPPLAPCTKTTSPGCAPPRCISA